MFTKDCTIRKNNPVGKVGLGKKNGMLNYRTNMSKHFEGLNDSVHSAYLAKPSLKILFEIKKFKIIYNIRKKLFNGRADCTHGTILSLLLESQYSLPVRCLEMYPKWVCWIPIDTHRLAGCWYSLSLETVVKA